MTEIRVKVKKRRPIISGIIYLCLGLFLLGQSSDLVPSFERSWPIFIIIVGIAWIAGALLKRDEPDQPYPDQGTNQ